MKKKVICLFSLIVYLLTACTILSNKIEEEMRTLVDVEIRTTLLTGIDTSMPLTALYTDSSGDHLYEVVDGDGWNGGLRIREVDDWTFGYAMNQYVSVEGGKDYCLVASASRQPPVGKLAQIVDTFETAPDTYLALYRKSVPDPYDLPKTMTILAQTENAYIIGMEEAGYPYLEHTVKTSSVTTDYARTIISLTEARQFLEQLPQVAVIPPILLSALLLWTYTWILAIRPEGRKPLLWLNAALIAATLPLLHYVLTKFDLPASILPPANILDFAHYKSLFSTIFTTLESLPTYLTPLTTALSQSLSTIRSHLPLLLIPLAIIFFETLYLLHRTPVGRGLDPADASV